MTVLHTKATKHQGHLYRFKHKSNLVKVRDFFFLPSKQNITHLILYWHVLYPHCYDFPPAFILPSWGVKLCYSFSRKKMLEDAEDLGLTVIWLETARLNIVPINNCKPLFSYRGPNVGQLSCRFWLVMVGVNLLFSWNISFDPAFNVGQHFFMTKAKV